MSESGGPTEAAALSSSLTQVNAFARMSEAGRKLSGEAKQMLVAQAKDYRMGISTLSKNLKGALTSSRAQEAARDELLRGAEAEKDLPHRFWAIAESRARQRR